MSRPKNTIFTRYNKIDNRFYILVVIIYSHFNAFGFMKLTKNLAEKIKDLPEKTGVYKYYDKNKKCIYIGKAKNLKKRVTSYFTKNHSNIKTKVLISKVKNIKYVILETEMDALLLENNLIKKLQPKYNAMLKDGKTYPWICISNDPVPKIFQTRVLNKKMGEYFGPYVSTHIVRTLLSVFSDLFYSHGWTPITYLNRTIKTDQDLKSYVSVIKDIRKILNGNLYVLINELKKEMVICSDKMNFEKAEIIKQKINVLQKYQSKSIIVSPKINDIDVFTIVSEEDLAVVNFLKINGGSIIQTYSAELQKKLDETDEDLLTHSIINLRDKFKSKAKEVCSSHYLENVCKGFTISMPKIGDKKKLVDLSLKNAKYILLDKKKQTINNLNRKNKNQILKGLQKDLNLTALPKHIECFDNSNLQGSNAVSACVVFKNAKPSKKDYRHFNIKTVRGPNDFASMEEIIYRRYKRIKNEGGALPDLIVIDGGIGQLNSAVKSLEKLNLKNKVPIISIAKRLEEIYSQKDNTPLFLDKRSQSLKLIQRLRDEAHRFSLKHHRNKRSKDALEGSLDKIKGIGEKSIKLLISHFGSTEQIMAANKKDIIKLIGKNKAEKIIKR